MDQTLGEEYLKIFILISYVVKSSEFCVSYWCVTFINILFKYDGRHIALILYGAQRCLNHHLNVSDSSPSLLYILVCYVPWIALAASATLHWTILLQNEPLFSWSQFFQLYGSQNLISNASTYLDVYGMSNKLLGYHQKNC